MGKTRDLFKKTGYQGNISYKDGHDKGQKWYGLKRSKKIKKNNRTGKTRDLFKKIGDIKGTFHAKMAQGQK